MNKFGLLEEEEPAEKSISERLSSFRAVRPRATVDLPAIDAAAAPHGFVSREAPIVPVESRAQGRRRRAIPSEPTRHLAIRLPASGYDRFVAYADNKRLTYHDALLELLDAVGW